MITKRHLGYAFIAVGLLVIAGVLAASVLDANLIGARDAGFGPLQLIGLGLGLSVIVMAIPLIKLGDKPA